MLIRFGVFVPQGWRMDLVQIKDPVEKYEAMTRVAQAADTGPWDSIWVFDHFHTVPTPEMEATFECWTTTSTLARDTTRVKVGQMVGCNGYRNPALYAKIASTVDVASHGRLYAGIGAGWYEHEWRAYGYGFPELKDRMAMFREACEIIHKMWTEDYPTFSGSYYAVDRPINEPKGVQKPHPPLWIGGSGERVTLKLVAKWGRRLQHRGRAGGHPPQARCTPAALPGPRPELRRHRQVDQRECLPDRKGRRSAAGDGRGARIDVLRGLQPSGHRGRRRHASQPDRAPDRGRHRLRHHLHPRSRLRS